MKEKSFEGTTRDEAEKRAAEAQISTWHQNYEQAINHRGRRGRRYKTPDNKTAPRACCPRQFAH
jgi:hypothetical protein